MATIIEIDTEGNDTIEPVLRDHSTGLTKCGLKAGGLLELVNYNMNHTFGIERVVS